MPLEQAPETKKNASEIERKAEITQAVERAEIMTLFQRIKYILDDPACRETVDASTRTILNTLITFVDGVPAAGDILESAVFASKISLPWLRSVVGIVSKRAAKWLRKADLTPDVSRTQSALIETASLPIEIGTFGTAPTYGIQALLQLRADLKNNRFDSGRRIVDILMTGRDLTPTSEQKKLLDEASREFK